MGKRELIALLNLSSWCLVMVERLFLAMPRGCLQFVIVVFPDHTHLLFLSSPVKILLTVQRRYFFCGSFMFFFCLVFAVSLCPSVYMCFVVTCWERANLLALLCGV